MSNKMLVDATHPEETRVVVLRGNRVEEFDFESANRRQLRGNIYLAKVTRVEPSLQAAFVDYGGNRHGFLAFSEIHPDYYQIPVADRQALIAEEERAQRAADAEIDRRAGRSRRPARAAGARLDEVRTAPAAPEETETASGEPRPAEESATGHGSESEAERAAEPTQADEGERAPADELEALEEASEPALEIERAVASEQSAPAQPAAESAERGNGGNGGNGGALDEIETEDDEAVESVGAGDAMEEVPERMQRGRRQYKIQEVIKRRQVMLVQVVKEERGTKGAALTTYLSLAGRYSVLMPNTARGGGISRKITDAQDRRRLKELAQVLEVPEGRGVSLRTAGANRTKAEIKRDFEYLLRLRETVRDLTLKSTAPTLVYEEGSLIKRSIRDLYNKDIDEVLVAGEEGYKDAKEFMRMLMPSHAKNVKLFRDTLPILTRFGIESQLDAMFQPVVQLRSGGYIVLNQAEALVALQLLRSLEEMLLKGATHNLIVRTRTEVALYLLNNKRAHLRALEERFQLAITVDADPTIGGQVSYVIDRREQVHSLEQARAIAAQPTSIAPVAHEDEIEDEEDLDEDETLAVPEGAPAEGEPP